MPKVFQTNPTAIPLNFVTATNTITTTSSTDALMASMTLSPAEGNYEVLFNCDVQCNNAGGAVSFSVYVNAVQVASSLLKTIPLDGGTLSIGTGRDIIFLLEDITVAAGQAVEIRWSTSGGTATTSNRKMRLMRIV